LEFGPLDVDRLARLGIQVDSLGPRLVVCMWDEGSPLEVGGFLVVDNLAMGRPSMGGIRMLPDVTPAAIHNLARGMTLKNAAADLPFGGGKAGIVADYDLSPEEHRKWCGLSPTCFARYKDIYPPGPDVGTNDLTWALSPSNQAWTAAVSKPVEMGGNRIDQLGQLRGRYHRPGRAAQGDATLSLPAAVHFPQIPARSGDCVDPGFRSSRGTRGPFPV
jgi:glutamate dehydrogenase (NAD(P)+)